MTNCIFCTEDASSFKRIHPKCYEAIIGKNRKLLDENSVLTGQVNTIAQKAYTAGVEVFAKEREKLKAKLADKPVVKTWKAEYKNEVSINNNIRRENISLRAQLAKLDRGTR